MQNTRMHDLKMAERGAILSIGAYIFLAVLQIAIANLVHSDALRANGFNNATDILGNVALLIGLRMARVPADANHVYGHWKVESISSLISSFIMALVAFELLRETAISIIENKPVIVDLTGAWIGIFSALLIFTVYLYNRRLSRKVSSPALKAASKDNLVDSFTSLGTSIAIIAASFNFVIVDRIAALIICIFIFHTAYTIFRDSAFSLSDGFDESLLDEYAKVIQSIDKVESIIKMRGRTYGSNIFLDVVISMSPDMSVQESHATTEVIENRLHEEFNVYDTDVHVEPSVLPDEEKEAALVLKLLHYEELMIAGQANQDEEQNGKQDNKDYRAGNFIEINPEGKFSKQVTKCQTGIMNFNYRHLSKRSYILYYEADGYRVSSTWRREGEWLCSFRQLTKEIK